MTTPRILVTGAGGFIGGRVVEILHLAGSGRPRALLRRWQSAPRIARFPVEIAIADVTSGVPLAEALRDIDAVVHCAFDAADRAAEGTRALLAAAEEAGVARFVHLSSSEVYGEAAGEVDESVPPRPATAYGRSKLAAEQHCVAAQARGLSICVLRPAIVYGPFSRWWTSRPAERLVAGSFGDLRAFGAGSCNLVYVDDLVAAILWAVRQPEVSGCLNVNGPERVTWGEYFRAFAAELNVPQTATRRRVGIRARSVLLAPLRSAAELAMRVSASGVQRVYERYPRSRGPMRAAEAALRLTPALEELRLYERSAHYSISRLSALGYTPDFPLQRGLRLSAAWWRHESGLVATPAAQPEEQLLRGDQ